MSFDYEIQSLGCACTRVGHDSVGMGTPQLDLHPAPSQVELSAAERRYLILADLRALAREIAERLREAKERRADDPPKR
jgi:hypothetical protein